MIPTHLKVLTIVERPFIYIKKKASGVPCEESGPGEGWEECPEYVFYSNSTPAQPTVGARYCCRGYCMDLLQQLRQTSNFTYSLYVSLQSGMILQYSWVEAASHKISRLHDKNRNIC